MQICVPDVDLLAFIVLYELPPPNDTGQVSKRRLDLHRGSEESLLKHHGTDRPLCRTKAQASAAEEVVAEQIQ